MDNFTVFLIYAAIAAFSFFVAAPITLNAISTFGVQKTFARDMIERGIIKEEYVKELEPRKQIAGIVVSAIVLVALFVASFNVKLGYISMAVGLVVGLIRYRHIIQFNSLTVKRFQNNYQDKYDKDKLNAYLKKAF